MKRNIARIVLLTVSSALSFLAQAQTAPTPAATPAATATMAAPAGKLRVPEGTEVPLLFVDSLSSAVNGEGDRFTLRVDSDVKVGGQTVIKAGSIAVGTVTNARKRGYMGKAGELNVILSHVTVGDDRVKLRASKGKTGDAKVGATVALTVLFGPIGLLKRGKDIEIKPGTPITAFVDETAEVAAQP